MVLFVFASTGKLCVSYHDFTHYACAEVTILYSEFGPKLRLNNLTSLSVDLNSFHFRRATLEKYIRGVR